MDGQFIMKLQKVKTIKFKKAIKSQRILKQINKEMLKCHLNQFIILIQNLFQIKLKAQLSAKGEKIKEEVIAKIMDLTNELKDNKISYKIFADRMQ